jgi:cysteine-rich repeat protein
MTRLASRLTRALLLLGAAAVGSAFTACSDDAATSPAPDAGGTGGTGFDFDGAITGACLDGVVDPDLAEECDDANDANGDGCQVDCTFTCVVGDPRRGDSRCDDGKPCNGAELCQADHTCQRSPALAEGASCGSAGVCRGGRCNPAVCGDGIVSGSEECDDGNAALGDGCDACRFSCVSTESTRDCTPSDPCAGASLCDDATHRCASRTPLGDGADCGNARTCRAGRCTATSCGDGTLETANGEDCEPPGSASCDASCRAVARCGDGRRQGSEQCDDANQRNLDGCDASCRYEVVHRIDSFEFSFGTDDFCTKNSFKSAFTAVGGDQLNQQLAGGDGTGTTALFTLIGLEDPTGTSDGSLAIGTFLADPVDAQSPAFATTPLDWWYRTIDDGSLDAQRRPIALIPGSVEKKLFQAGPGRAVVSATLNARTVRIDVADVVMRGSIGAATLPMSQSGSAPSGVAAALGLDPSLLAFESTGSDDVLLANQLCAVLPARSVDRIPFPERFTGTSLAACREGYPKGASLLSVLLHGCTVVGVPAVLPTQPDSTVSDVPAPGAGGPYSFASTPGGGITACVDARGARVDLEQCFAAAGYSVSINFGTRRVVVRAD